MKCITCSRGGPGLGGGLGVGLGVEFGVGDVQGVTVIRFSYVLRPQTTSGEQPGPPAPPVRPRAAAKPSGASRVMRTWLGVGLVLVLALVLGLGLGLGIGIVQAYAWG